MRQVVKRRGERIPTFLLTPSSETTSLASGVLEARVAGGVVTGELEA